VGPNPETGREETLRDENREYVLCGARRIAFCLHRTEIAGQNALEFRRLIGLSGRVILARSIVSTGKRKKRYES